MTGKTTIGLWESIQFPDPGMPPHAPIGVGFKNNVKKDGFVRRKGNNLPWSTWHKSGD
jgi:hypothetical protein